MEPIDKCIHLVSYRNRSLLRALCLCVFVRMYHASHLMIETINVLFPFNRTNIFFFVLLFSSFLYQSFLMFVKIENSKCFVLSFAMFAPRLGCVPWRVWKSTENFSTETFRFYWGIFLLLRLEERKAVSFRLLLRYLSIRRLQWRCERGGKQGNRTENYHFSCRFGMCRGSRELRTRIMSCFWADSESWSQEKKQSVFARK